MDSSNSWGVADGWWATDGAWQTASSTATSAVSDALGARDYPDGPPESHVWFVEFGSAPPLHSPAVLALEDGTTLEVNGCLPEDLPLGGHELWPADGGPRTWLFVIPERAPIPTRSWGWAAQLYASRSLNSWGHGDLGDLATLARWAEKSGASWLAHEPLGAFRPPSGDERIIDSPYSASSRRFPSPLYLRVEDIAGAELAAAAVERAVAAGRRLLKDRRIDRDQVWANKRSALEAIYSALSASDGFRATAATTQTESALRTHALFCAISELHAGGWQEWPAELRRPDSGGVARFAAAHSERVAMWEWLTRVTQEQLTVAAASGAKLLGDLPVGFDPGGSDAWVDQDLLAHGCRIGAPPDDFAPDGQDWGLTPYLPWRLRAVGYRPWIQTVRAAVAHAGALRIDHVMGLFRLYWVPAGATASDGTYVSQFGGELLDIAVMEAAKVGAVIVGEDLGTVEPSVRDAMGTRGVLGYRIGWFEDAEPTTWPEMTLAAATTHDLPTIAGVWTGADAARRTAAGLAVDDTSESLLRSRLQKLGNSGDGAPVGEVILSAESAVASSPSLIALATLDDAVGCLERPNQPGTTDELPNWRLALPVAIEDLDGTGAPAIAAAMRHSRRSAGGTPTE